MLIPKLLGILFPDASWHQEDENQEHQWWKPQSQQSERLFVPCSIQALNGFGPLTLEMVVCSIDSNGNSLTDTPGDDV